jgi:hypothetical protein
MCETIDRITHDYLAIHLRNQAEEEHRTYRPYRQRQTQIDRRLDFMCQ